MADGPARRRMDPVLVDLIVTCPRCHDEVIDRDWLQLESTGLHDVAATMGAHVQEKHPGSVSMFVEIGEAVGVLRPPPNL